MTATTATPARISRRTVEAGMSITVLREEFGIRTAAFVVAEVCQAGDWTVVTTEAGRKASLTNNDVIHVLPAEGEVWA